MSILSLLQLALSLLVSVQGPNVPVELRQQALDTAQQIVEIASIQIQSMQNEPAQVNNEPQLPQNPTPQATSTQPTEPIFGSASSSEPVSPYTVETSGPVSKSGGVFTFTVKKNGKPVEVIDQVSGNVTYQVFVRLPEDLPPGRGQFHISIPSQTEDVENPSLNLLIEGTTVNVPISFTQ